ncbi:Poly-gamma-glutamate biosynthesis protein CapA/YwtB (capsule formation), metallophosphatase superfamily [Amycolatopsis xylanica]|uniref:Poly-gamma-glutamate biosynthesis protein CapA/YwtB (Capsule formation), metallophosphatase superfamily n=1 Tax=Amycolatopsis xylanica TaxID=589385 RepID=A0A1H2TYK2_9PSEU|nr:CapA family protein [Amycolatopsis xylanica]SDW48820.1 Poly-gamma-glutamate biosynthesis protein CapA/YwtB (capsule formation), metallophosphatase superfamily [Amycolatopsis xylanica]
MKRPYVLAAGTLVVVGTTVAVAWPGPDAGGTTAAPPTVSLSVVDEAGAPVPATVDIGDGAKPVAARVELRSGPVLATVSAPGHLAEPVPLGLEDAGKTVPVRLLSDHGGKRYVLHSAGDVMFGRRYQDAPEPLVPRTDAGRGAESVVDAIAPAFRLADLRTVNLESVISAAPREAAYPSKRFILESPPATTDGLKKLGVDVPSLANNHTRDFQDAGLADTTTALTAAGFPIVGLADGDRPQPAYHKQIRGNEVTMLAYTSVDGSFVNDSYARSPEGEAWQNERRHWQFGTRVPDAARTIGEAWQIFDRLEAKLPPSEVAALWTSITQVYPELQDWVARRGHGGAAPWNPKTSPAEISAAKKGLTVVQLHSGFQFQTASGKSTREMARAAIDAGADLVIAHHPHVLQGMEWYKGHLIAYSMGNFVFDQDFLATFSSAFLRTVWEGDQLVEARVVPVEIDGYRPAAATGGAARRTLNGMWANGLRDVQAQREPDQSVSTTPFVRDQYSRPAQFRFEHGTARLTADAPPESPVPVTVPPHSDAVIPFDGLIRPEGPLSVGRDLFGWGHFEDDTADGDPDAATHWPPSTGPLIGGGALGDAGYLQLSGNPTGKLARPVARIALPRQPEAAYTVRAKVRVSPGATPLLRVTSYHFDDSDPTEDPDSRLLRDIDRTTQVPSDGAWHEISFDLTPAELGEGGNMVLLYAGVRGDSAMDTVDLDDLEFVEWRPATGDWAGYDYVRNHGDTAVTATFHGMGSR